MNSLVEKIMNADKAMNELYDAVLGMFNQDDMDYKIEFKGITFDFCKPLTQDDKYHSDAQKHTIASLLLEDSFDRIVDMFGSKGVSESSLLRYKWINIANLQRAVTTREIESTIVSEVPYEVDEETSKPLDYDSIYVQAQRKDLSDEDKWSILLRGMLDKESIQSTNE